MGTVALLFFKVVLKMKKLSEYQAVRKVQQEKFFRAFLLKAEFNLPTTKVLIESLRTNTSWRLLCGWEYSSRIPSEATFSRAFAEFAKAELPSAVHEEIVVENCHDELIGHASKDSTAIEVREKPCRRKKRTCKMKKKRGRKSNAKKAALQAKEKEEIRTRLQSGESGSDFLSLVPEAGVEPARCRHHWILSPARLPIPSHRQKQSHYSAQPPVLQVPGAVFFTVGKKSVAQ